MKKATIFILGIITGILISIFGFSYLSGNKYAVLNGDYSLSNGGTLKKGTKIKYNAAFSEGFTQYILYLNMPIWKENNLSFEKEKYAIIPYWIEPLEKNQNLNTVCDSIFEFGEKMPKFKGGDAEFLNYNTKKIIPIVGELNKQNNNVISRLHYYLTISKDGKILDAEIITEIDEKFKGKLEKELLKMPKWIAGKVKGKAECMRIKIPISCIQWE